MGKTTAAAPVTYWLSGASNDYAKSLPAESLPVGLLIQPGNKYENQIDAYPVWAADNGAFKKGSFAGDFDFERFADYLDRRLANLTDEQIARCLFVNCPDAIDVSKDGRTVTSYPELTLERFAKWAPRVRALGVPVALVGQPGMELMIDELPWDELDVIFLGGDNEWKLGEGARILAAAARARGKKVHMGRVNSRRRLHLAASIGCDSADGTFLAIAGGEAGIARVRRWFPGLELVERPAVALITTKTNDQENETMKTITVTTVNKYGPQEVAEGILSSRSSETVLVFGGRRYGIGISDGTVINMGPGLPRRPLARPEAYAFALSICLDNYGGTGAEAARNRAVGLEFDVELGDLVVFDGTDTFEVGPASRYSEGFSLVAR